MLDSTAHGRVDQCRVIEILGNHDECLHPHALERVSIWLNQIRNALYRVFTRIFSENRFTLFGMRSGLFYSTFSNRVASDFQRSGSGADTRHHRRIDAGIAERSKGDGDPALVGQIIDRFLALLIT